MKLSRFEERIRRHLYDRGHTDDNIAERMGLKVEAVKRWRRRNGLPENLTPRE